MGSIEEAVAELLHLVEIPSRYRSVPTSAVSRSQHEIDDLVREGLPVVQFYLRKFKKKAPPHIDFEDLAGELTLVLLHAARLYDSSRGVSFSAYIQRRVDGGIKDFSRRADHLGRRTRARVAQLRQLERSSSGCSPSEEQLENVGFTSTLYETFRELQEISHVDIKTVEGVLEDPYANPEGRFYHEEQRQHGARLVENLPDSERITISLYYYGDCNFREIGVVLGVTESRVCQLHGKAVRRLQAMAVKEGLVEE